MRLPKRLWLLIAASACLLIIAWPSTAGDTDVTRQQPTLLRAPCPNAVERGTMVSEFLDQQKQKAKPDQFNGICPMLYSSNHSLVNTGRKALVLYTMTSHADVFERQVEIDNFMFFRAHGMMPPKTPTALFSSVDYVIATSKMDRNPSGDQSTHDIVQCARSENVRVLEGPSAPCDLCAQSRVIEALGGPEAVARQYEFVVLVNSGTRGPWFTEAPVRAGSPPPVTWIDHFALGGEKVYTGAIYTSVIGTGQRPYLTSFAVGSPTSALMALQPVLSAGCSDAPLPRFFLEYSISFDAELHKMHDNATEELLTTLKFVRDNPETLKSTPRGPRDAAAQKIDEKIATGAQIHRQRAIDTIAAIARDKPIPPWPERKMKCVYRAEVQLLNTVLKTKLPLEIGDKRATSTAAPRWLRRPKLSAEHRSLLSPVLSGYMHEGHFFARSLHHEQTIVTMGHGLVFLEPGRGCNFCGEVFPKYGGVAWRSKAMGQPCIAEWQMATMAQQPRRLAPVVHVGEVLRCPNRGPVEPFRQA